MPPPMILTDEALITSVISNVQPQVMASIVQAYCSGKWSAPGPIDKPVLLQYIPTGLVAAAAWRLIWHMQVRKRWIYSLPSQAILYVPIK